MDDRERENPIRENKTLTKTVRRRPVLCTIDEAYQETPVRPSPSGLPRGNNTFADVYRS